MRKIDFNNKTFSLVENSERGQVNTDTIFEFQQEDNIVTANYYGGSIRSGKIIALLKGEQMHMLYQCVTIENELKAGKAIATISFNPYGKIILGLNWEWLTGSSEKGNSEYLEN